MSVGPGVRCAILLLLGTAFPAWLASGQEAGPAGPETGPADPPDVVVIGRRPPRCHPRPGDPQDAVDLAAAASGARQFIGTDPATRRLALLADSYPETGPDVWQRAAIRMDRYVFRTPANGDPLCIGARGRFVPGEAQLRRAFAARPYWGKYVVLSAMVAARDAGRVDMWIVGGANDPHPRKPKDVARDVVAGGFKQVPITGNYTWRQVNFLLGPVPCFAAQISYGLQLQGGGDVWLAKPVFVEVPENRLSRSMRLRPHGAAMLASDPVCRHFREGRPLWINYGGQIRRAEEDEVVPTNFLLERREDVFANETSEAQGLSRDRYRPLSREAETATGLYEF